MKIWIPKCLLVDHFYQIRRAPQPDVKVAVGLGGVESGSGFIASWFLTKRQMLYLFNRVCVLISLSLTTWVLVFFTLFRSVSDSESEPAVREMLSRLFGCVGRKCIYSCRSLSRNPPPSKCLQKILHSRHVKNKLKGEAGNFSYFWV